MFEEINVREISFGSEDYRQELGLRDEVLRKPLGMSIYNDNRDGEKHDYHIGAFVGKELVGVMIMTKLNNREVKMRQVSVREAWRKKNVGRQMILFAEEYSKVKEFKCIVLNARETAVGFYEKLGYEKVSEAFLEISIPHYKMRKLL